MQCFVGDEARRRRAIEDRVVAVFEGWDYEEIIPPLYDYADVFAGPALAAEDLLLRGPRREPARPAPRLHEPARQDRGGPARGPPGADPPLLLGRGAALRAAEGRAARASCSRWGSSTWAATAPARRRRGAGDRRRVPGRRSGVGGWVLALGHVGRLRRPRRRVAASTPRASRRCASASRQGRGGRARRRCAGVARPPRRPRRSCASPRWPETSRVLDEAAAGLRASRRPRSRRSASCARVVEALSAAGLGDRVAIDLGEVRGLDYYTGLVFRAYAPGLGFEVGGGGRYDALLGALRPADARGGLHARPRPRGPAARAAGQRCPRPRRRRPSPSPARDLGDALRARARERAARRRVRLEGRERPMSLTVALSKGKLLAGSEALFRTRGPAVSRGRGPQARGGAGRPALPVREGHGRARPTSSTASPTAASRAATSCSKSGSDVYEPLDLGFGRCRLVVARPRGSAVDYRRARTLRVATKYPRVAAGHFLERGVSVEVVKLAGSVELAPGLGPRRLHRGRGGDGAHARGERPRAGGGRGGVVGAPHREPRELPRPPRRTSSRSSRPCGGRSA